VTIILLYINP